MMEKDRLILEKYEKKCKIINGVFIAFVLITFAAFIILLMKVERGLPHFIVAGLLIGAAVLYKFTDKKMKARRLSLNERLMGRDGEGLHMILRSMLYDNDRGELKKYFSTMGKDIKIDAGDNSVDISGSFGSCLMKFHLRKDAVEMSAETEEKVTALRRAKYADIGTPEGVYKIFSEFISRNY